MTNAQFEQVYYEKYKGVIKALARKLARRDQDLFDDLESIGLIALLDLDPASATVNEDAYIRQRINNKMVDHLRRERPAKYESLEGHLNRGDQVVADPVTGEARLIHATVRPVREPPPEEDDDG